MIRTASSFEATANRSKCPGGRKSSSDRSNAPAASTRFEFDFSFSFGRIDARGDPDVRYRLPLKIRARCIQSFGGLRSHTGAQPVRDRLRMPKGDERPRRARPVSLSPSKKRPFAVAMTLATARMRTTC